MQACFMLWIDVELAWGLVHRKKLDLPKVKATSVNVRKKLGAITGIIEKYQIPVTWAILGHLLLDCCSKESNGLPHRDMPRPNYSWLKDDWYRYDPCTSAQQEPAWYGKDIADKIIEYIQSSKLHHDVGCHSFSHQLFGDSGCGKELARAEIKRCIELMQKEYHITPQVFSFPRDYVGHIDLLKKYGFFGFRDVPTKLHPCLKLEKTVSNFLNIYCSLFTQFLSYYLLLPPHVVNAKEHLPGLWAVQGCLAYSRKQLIPLSLVTLKAKKGIDQAIKERKIFCMYTHLSTFGENGRLFSDFEDILLHVNMKREKGLLDVKTMTKLVKEFEAPVSM